VQILVVFNEMVMVEEVKCANEEEANTMMLKINKH